MFAATVHRGVDATADPALGARARAGQLGRVTCPACTAEATVDVPVVYHDRAQGHFVLVLPTSLRHRELHERAALLLALAADPDHAPPRYVREFLVAYGGAGLELALVQATVSAGRTDPAGASTSRETLGAGATATATSAAATASTIGAAPVAPAATAALAAPTALADGSAASQRAAATSSASRGESGTGPYERLDDEVLRQVVVSETPLPGPLPHPGARRAGSEGVTAAVEVHPDLVVERWIASRRPAHAVLHAGRVRLFAVVEGGEAERLVGGPVELTVGLHRMEAGPIVVVRAAPPGGESVSVCLDPTRSEDRELLVALAQKAAISLELFDAEYRPLFARALAAPIEENVRLCLSAVDEPLRAPGPSAGRRDFAAAVAAWQKPGHDRTGKRAQSLAESSFEDLVGPTATKMALEVVGFWSEPESEDYLLLVRGFPLPWWRALRGRVLERAVALGLALPSHLAQLAISQGLARSRKDLALRLTRNFAVAAPGSDFDARAVQSNWRALVAECEALGLPLSGAAAEQATGAVLGPTVPEPGQARSAPLSESAKAKEVEVARRRIASPVVAGEIGATGPAPRDPGGLPAAELLLALDDKDGRLAAAIELCRRGETSAVGPVFGALRRMTRGEAVRVVPHVVGFGERAVPHLVDALRSRKAFLRHGAALALGVLKSGDGIEPLCDLLLAEPTDVWREVSRAIGELGGGAVMSLAARLRETPPEQNERVAWALAHVAGRGARAPVEALAGGRDERAAQVARRALALVPGAVESDAEVRGPRTPGSTTEHTVNRAFSRRFFEALANDDAATVGGDPMTLDDADVVEDRSGRPGLGQGTSEEELGDEDLLPG
jgi:hypothetical protein